MSVTLGVSEPRGTSLGTRAARGGRRAEAIAAVVVGFAVSVVLNWPIVRHARSLVPADLGDPLLQTWQLAWLREYLVTGGDFWDANFYHPARDVVAFTDTLLGYAPLTVIGEGTAGAVLRYNVAFVFAYGLAFIGGYALVRQLGAAWQGAALAGVVFAWTPWRLAHDSHLNILSTGGIALALFALVRGHGYTLRDGFRPERVRVGWIVAGWLIAMWQISIGFAIGLPFVYALGVVSLVAFVAVLRGRWRPGRSVILTDVLGAAAFLGFTYLMARPYLAVSDRYGFHRTEDDLYAFSPPADGFLRVVDSSWLWHGSVLNRTVQFVQERAIFPGLVILLAGVIGVFLSAWPLRVRVGLAIAAVTTGVLALGKGFFDGAAYDLLWRFAPGFEGLRTPGRLVLWTIILLMLLAAGLVTDAVRRARGRRVLTGLMVLPAVLALVEGIPSRPYVAPIEPPAAVRAAMAQAPGAVAILPMSPLANETYISWSIDGFPELANGESGWKPPEYRSMAEALRRFPDARSVELLRRNGVSTVVVLTGDISGTDYDEVLSRPSTPYGVRRADHPDAVVFELSPP